MLVQLSPPQSRDWINFFDECFLDNNSSSGKSRQGNEMALASLVSSSDTQDCNTWPWSSLPAVATAIKGELLSKRHSSRKLIPSRD